MTEQACTVPKPEQRKFLEIRETAERSMFDKVFKAIDEAAAEAARGSQDAGLDFEPTSRDYFMFATWQIMFVRLCGGDPETLQGGDPDIGQHIIDSYWRIEKGAQANLAKSSPD